MKIHSILWAALLCTAIQIASVAGLLAIRPYGLWMFLGCPLLAGAMAETCAWLWKSDRFGDVVAILGTTVPMAAACLVALRIEGLICIAMMLPLAAPVAVLGALLTRLALRPRRRATGGAAVLLMAIPLAGLNSPPSALRAVESHVTIDAPPETVWKNVIQFPDLPAPDEWFFRAGLAYPIRARIEGSGPGATRYCEFSTGDFVEPIRVWNEPKLLRFDVSRNPEPLRELSPYDLHPAHLHGYFNSRHGQFLLTRLAGGRTLLSGTTWYEQKLRPAPYWELWSDEIVHRIHLRVLNHIKRVSERG